MCAKTTMGVLLLSGLTSFSSHSELIGPQRAQPASLQVDDVDESDEVRAVVVEALPAGAECAPAESLPIGRPVVLEDVVLARHVETGSDSSEITCWSVSNSDSAKGASGPRCAARTPAAEVRP